MKTRQRQALIALTNIKIQPPKNAGPDARPLTLGMGDEIPARAIEDALGPEAVNAWVRQGRAKLVTITEEIPDPSLDELEADHEDAQEEE